MVIVFQITSKVTELFKKQMFLDAEIFKCELYSVPLIKKCMLHAPCILILCIGGCSNSKISNTVTSLKFADFLITLTWYRMMVMCL